MINPNDDGYQEGLLIYQMLDELASDLGYEDGAQDLIGEEHCVNIELLQIVMERLEYAREVHRVEMEIRKRLAEEEIQRAYQ